MADTAAVGAAAPAAADPSPAPKKYIKDWSTQKVLRTLRMANFCNGILLILGAVLVFGTLIL